MNKVEKNSNENNLATNVIHKLIKIILFLLIFMFINNVVWIIGWIWNSSLPIEETEIVQDADTVGNDSPIAQQIGE